MRAEQPTCVVASHRGDHARAWSAGAQRWLTVAWIVAACFAVASHAQGAPVAPETSGSVTTSATTSSRFAVVVGARLGDPSETPLRYARRDAERMAEVLETVGDVDATRLWLLIDPRPQEIERALDRVAEEVARARATSPNQSTELIFFYSGHAGVQGMHLDGAYLGFGDLIGAVEGTQADLRVVIVDACNAGEITRAKGAEPAEPFEIFTALPPTSAGLAILTSSAHDEISQESDRLESSIFTHHLLSGLRGAADTSGDGVVSLSEAYAYAHAETVRATSRTPALQNPTYFFDLRGARDPVMTRVTGNHASGVVTIDQPGRYLFFEDSPRAPLMGEFAIDEAPAYVAMRHGDYVVVRRHLGAATQGSLYVDANATTTLTTTSFVNVDDAVAGWKGPSGRPGAGISLTLGGAGAGAMLPGHSAALGGFLGASIHGTRWGVEGRLRSGASSASGATWSAQQWTVGGDLGVHHLLVHRRGWSLRAGLRIGVDRVRQRVDDIREIERIARSPRGGPVIGVERRLGARGNANLFFEGSADAHALRRDTREPSTQIRFVPQGAVGLRVYLR